MANREVDNLALLVAPIGADVYAAKTNTDYRIRVGEANGLATLDAGGKLPAAQTVAPAFADITSKPTTVAGYGITDAVTAAGFTWAALSGKPTTFAPSAHTHSGSDITSGTVPMAAIGTGTKDTTTWLRGDGIFATLPVGAGTSWGGISGTLANQTDLQAALNAKQAAGSYAAASHTHTTAEVTGLDAALASKQPAGSYAAASHTHTMSQITDAGTWATKNQTVSTSAPSGTPAAGDVWLQYTP